MVRLTVDLVNNSLSYINPLKERELDLRGNKIPQIENLGVATTYDTLDLTANSLPSLTNFPLLPRLTTLLLSTNRISHISPQLATQLPNLSTINLSNNRLTELSDIDPLRGCRSLTHVVLIGNPLCNRQYYRLWVIWRLKNVRFLDFKRVRDEERKEAGKLFGEWSDDGQAEEGLTTLAKKIVGSKSNTSKSFDSGSKLTKGGAEDDDNDMNGNNSGVLDGISRMKFTEEEKKRIRKALEMAKNDVELDRLQRMIAQGQVPDLPDLDMGGV